MSYQPRIKICGITNVDIARAAVMLGIPLIGLMCYRSSKRYVTLEHAKQIAKAVKKAGGTPVAVFVDATAEIMQAFCQACEIDHVQLHGDIARAQHHHLPAHYHRIYAIPVNERGALCADVSADSTHLLPTRDQLLFDHREGGQGIAIHFTDFIYQGPFDYFLAGGLTADTVANVIKQHHPAGVDVSSGVENSAGIKTMPLIRAFYEAVQTCAIP